ncbi:MAG TPA: hypothetical protein V6D10_20085 [Trichocoleus sp.]
MAVGVRPNLLWLAEVAERSLWHPIPFQNSQSVQHLHSTSVKSGSYQRYETLTTVIFTLTDSDLGNPQTGDIIAFLINLTDRYFADGVSTGKPIQN